MVMGKIDGNAPKLSKSPSTKRATNLISDVVGAAPKDRGSMPAEMRHQLKQASSMVKIPSNGALAVIPEKPSTLQAQNSIHYTDPVGAKFSKSPHP